MIIKNGVSKNAGRELNDKIVDLLMLGLIGLPSPSPRLQ